MNKIVVLLILSLSYNGVWGNGEFFKSSQKRGPQYSQTKGEPWPMPQLINVHPENFMIIRPTLFRFDVTRNTCGTLEQALKRYYSIFLNSNPAKISGNSFIMNNRVDDTPLENSTIPHYKIQRGFNGYLDTLKIDLMGACEHYPHDQMDESYEIKIDTPDFHSQALLTAPQIWGILRGLETFSQLIHQTDDYSALQVKSTLITDYPRFAYRSILLDSSRHYLSKKVIFENLDLMAFNKYNVFHWHITDDQSFPYQSKIFPQMSELGSYHPYTHVYTQQDVKDIIEYARVRGIRVITEFDTPGHTQSWGAGIPGFLTECFNKTGHRQGIFGPVDPTKSENFVFLRKMFQEIAEVFPDKYLHLGGDEVDYTCWQSNPRINDFMKDLNISGNYAKLEEYYMQNLVNVIHTFPQNNSYIVWQEVIDNGVEMDNTTIAHVWKRPDYKETLERVTKLGYRALLSACWYLNYISYGIDWPQYYRCDPQDFNGTDAQKRLVMGGGPAMWGEFIDSTNLITTLWPRASAPAERLWSNENVKDVSQASPRLEEHRCRLLRRGFNVKPPNGPGFCLMTWD